MKLFYNRHIFFCTNLRADHKKASCGKHHSIELRNYMKKKVFDLKLKNIRVNQSGCLDKCESGPVMVIYPQGVWYNFKNKMDIDEIINSHLVKGKVVKRLLLKS